MTASGPQAYKLHTLFLKDIHILHTRVLFNDLFLMVYCIYRNAYLGVIYLRTDESVRETAYTTGECPLSSYRCKYAIIIVCI